MKIQIKKLREDAVIPEQMHEGDAGFDLYSCETGTLNPLERKIFPTGLAMAIPIGYEGQVRPKSGLAAKLGLSIVNTPGTVDAGYRGEVGVIVINLSNEPVEIKKGMKIAQMVINQVGLPEFEVVEELSETTRGEGGFGSTGLHHS